MEIRKPQPKKVSESGTVKEPEESTSLDGLDSWDHTVSVIALCCCNFTNAWLVISVFPYSGFMAIELIPNANEENAGSYAGLLASFFMVGRALTAYGWGNIADIYGRKFVILSSLGLSCFFSLLFGASQSFTIALLWRFMLGLGNGMVATAKTVVSEIAYGNERLETRGMGLGEKDLLGSETQHNNWTNPPSTSSYF